VVVGDLEHELPFAVPVLDNVAGGVGVVAEELDGLADELVPRIEVHHRCGGAVWSDLEVAVARRGLRVGFRLHCSARVVRRRRRGGSRWTRVGGGRR
jgi:hypothetical protein